MQKNSSVRLIQAVESLRDSWCAPYLPNSTSKNISSSQINQTKPKPTNHLSKIYFSYQFQIENLLASKIWIDKDILSIASNFHQKRDTTSEDSRLSNAFFQKYGNLLFSEDARAVAIDWHSDFNRALSHVNQKAIKGKLLHIGCDLHFEASYLHSQASSVVLADISEGLLSMAASNSPHAKVVCTKAEMLTGIKDKSINFLVALRVFCSAKFDQKAAITQATRVLCQNGSILLSVSNGYKAIDETILSGLVSGNPPQLDVSQPFEEAFNILNLLYGAGFRELFLIPGSTELFLGGTYLPNITQINYDPILHVESVDCVPLCFYSDLMPTSWLVNFSSHPVKINNTLWPTVEHFFQAEKFSNPTYQDLIQKCPTPYDAKSFAWSKQSEVKTDWATLRLNVMREGLRAKFDQYPNLKKALLKTNNRELIERSSDDKFWGRTVSGEGSNMLGTLLMELREYYKRT